MCTRKKENKYVALAILDLKMYVKWCIMCIEF